MKFAGMLLPLICSCISSPQNETGDNSPLEAYLPAASDNSIDLEKLFTEDPCCITAGFDFPVGIPHAKGYYNAQGFRENNHLGDDWNGNGGGNSDLGDPIHSIASGYVTEARDEGAGWGNVVRIVHGWKQNDSWQFVESLYAHLDTMLVKKGQWLQQGDKIGTIGNANGAYYAHLHMEIRTETGSDLGGGYSADTTGYVNPTLFIQSHRHIGE